MFKRKGFIHFEMAEKIWPKPEDKMKIQSIIGYSITGNIKSIRFLKPYRFICDFG